MRICHSTLATIPVSVIDLHQVQLLTQRMMPQSGSGSATKRSTRIVSLIRYPTRTALYSKPVLGVKGR